MMNRLKAIPPKKGGVQPSFSRGRKLCALIPKSGRKSSNDDSSTESENEIRHYPIRHRTDEDSSPVPSLPSSMENLNLLSDGEIIDVQEAVTASPLAASPLNPLAAQNMAQSVTTPQQAPAPTVPQSPRTPLTSTRSRAISQQCHVQRL